jgi:hypothetical protein
MSVTANQPVLLCPHCNEYIIIEKINCAIFRHGVLHLFTFQTPIFILICFL